ncbi:MAG: nuclear transport factor 2 family protein [Hoeflea sp.]|uniref:nuclear transport factor 2 family protein n=1 Tax=Hoeflea sp. TaxID=1940281 RepID=UPI0032979468|tara:strand:+ start:17589 stop:18119 length:531 start_codon:yes stop_codon:yes gene_type:complete
MNSNEFNKLLARFTIAAESGDGDRFAQCFTPDGVYYDYIYGVHRGRESIAHMMQNLFHRDAGDDYRWEMFDGVIDGNMGYAWSLSSFSSRMERFKGNKVVIDGMSRFILRDGLIAEYRESVNGGVAMTQLGVETERMRQVFGRWVGWLQDRPATKAYLGRERGQWANGVLLENIED